MGNDKKAENQGSTEGSHAYKLYFFLIHSLLKTYYFKVVTHFDNTIIYIGFLYYQGYVYALRQS